jgi:hypothetical protein
VGGTGEAGSASGLQLLVPAYFYPSGPGLVEWERLFEAATRVPIVAVANPASGVGEESNPDYADVIARANQRGVVVVGYVFTDYARRPAAEVEEEIDRWVRFYPSIRGIFFDAQASNAGHVEYYAGLSAHAREAIENALIITNPGTTCDREYANPRVTDVIIIYEGTAGFDRFALPRWAEGVSDVRFAALPHQVELSERMRDFVQLASRRGIALLYVAESGYDRLPDYWEEQVEAVRRLGRGEGP